jgi:hypothetical protein
MFQICGDLKERSFHDIFLTICVQLIPRDFDALPTFPFPELRGIVRKRFQPKMYPKCKSGTVFTKLNFLRNLQMAPNKL